jgi:CubicO group peptidase (beta-lactamase class C family)
MSRWRLRHGRPRRAGRVLTGLAMLLLLLLAAAAKAGGAASLPNTVAALRLQALLTSFNQGDSKALERFVATTFAPAERDPAFAAQQAGQLHRLHQLTGPLELRQVEASDTSSLRVLAQARRTSAWYRLSVFTTAAPPDFTAAAPPYKIVGLGIDAVGAPPALAETGLDDRRVGERLDRLMEQMVQAGGFSGVVQVQRGERTLYARAFGEADRGAHIPNRLHTRFNLASITKMFTAVAIGQLVDAGKLRLDDPVGRWLPELAGSELGRQVTVHHLLSHTSGVVGAREAIEKGLEPPREARTVSEMTTAFLRAPLSFRPGQQFGYSNAGYVLLGAIIERASGEGYHAYVQRHVFEAAGMHESGFVSPGDPRGDVAIGYMDAPGGQRVPNGGQLPLAGSPAHMAYSTAGDMTRFAEALYRGRLLHPDLLERFWTGVTEQPDGVEYGYGARIERRAGRRIVWHGGGAPGVTNRFEMVPAEGLTIVVLANVDTEPELVANKLREWLSPAQPAAVAEAAAPPELILSVRPAQAAVGAGQEAAIELQVANRGGTAHAVVVDLEIKDEAGRKVEQQFVADQRLGASQTRAYRFVWRPASPGRYQVGAGVFGPGWNPRLKFEDGLAAIEAR